MRLKRKKNLPLVRRSIAELSLSWLLRVFWALESRSLITVASIVDKALPNASLRLLLDSDSDSWGLFSLESGFSPVETDGSIQIKAWSVVERCTLAVYHAICIKDFRCSKKSFIIEFCSKINTETCWQYRPTAICEHASGYLYLFLCCMIYFYIISLSFFSYKFYCYMLVLILKYFAYLIFFGLTRINPSDWWPDH